MCDVPVFYATSEGQTRRIAERLASRLHEHGLDSRPMAIKVAGSSPIDWLRVRGVVVAASLHMQKHQPEAVAFARTHCEALAAIPSLFVSVSLSAASKNPEEVQRAQQIAEGFAEKTGWRPARVASVAGRLAYTQYNWLVKRIMRRIAVKEGGSADMSRDHEYTDWDQVAALAEALATEIRAREGSRAATAPLQAVS